MRRNVVLALCRFRWDEIRSTHPNVKRLGDCALTELFDGPVNPLCEVQVRQIIGHVISTPFRSHSITSYNMVDLYASSPELNPLLYYSCLKMSPMISSIDNGSKGKNSMSARADSLEHWLSTKQVADRYNVPTRTVLRMIREGRLRARKFEWVWVVHTEDLPDTWPPPKSNGSS